MFNRAAYKKIAKKQLNGRWKTPILAQALFSGIVLILYLPILIANSGLPADFEYKIGEHSYSVITKMNTFPSVKYSFLLNLSILAITGIFTFAQRSFFLKMARTKDELDFSVFLEGFNNFILGIFGILWELLWLILWVCLFYIAIFPKLYAYSRMFHILADNPKIGVRKALRLSKELTRGYKGELFVLDMSFAGYWLLVYIPIILSIASIFEFPGKMPFFTLLSFVIQSFFMPYYDMTQTNVYLVLKEVAIKTGRVSKSDFDPEASNAEDDWEPFSTKNEQTDFSRTADTAGNSYNKAENAAGQIIENQADNTHSAETTGTQTEQAPDVIQPGPQESDTSDIKGENTL